MTQGRVEMERMFPVGRLGNLGSSVPPATVGALRELVAAVHLMEKGYHVFRALSPSCACDLVAYRDGETPIRIEVRSAPTKPLGFTYRYRGRGKPDAGRQDHFALVTHDGEVFYCPELPTG